MMDAPRSDLAQDTGSSATLRTSPANPPADKPKRGSSTTRITVKEICERLRVSERTVYALLGKEIPGIRLGRTWLISRYAYEKWERAVGTNRLTQSEVE